MIFFCCQIKSVLANGDFMTIKINNDRAGENAVVGMTVCAADNRVKRGDQFLPVKRFGQIRIRPLSQGNNTICYRCAARDHENRSVNIGAPHRFCELETITVRKVDIKNNSIKIFFTYRTDTFLGGITDHVVMAFSFKRHANAFCDNRIIFNNKNVHFFSYKFAIFD